MFGLLAPFAGLKKAPPGPPPPACWSTMPAAGYVRIAPRTDCISTPKYVKEDNTELAMQGEALGKTDQTVAVRALACGFIAEGAALIGNSLPS